MPSHEVAQQYGSKAQIVETQFAVALSHPETSALPAVQSGWEQAPSDSVQVRLLQTVRTSVTQLLPHALLQQPGSTLQIDVMHALPAPEQPDINGAPAVH